MNKSILISATRERVWAVLTQPELLKQWYAAFKEGTYAITDWQTGSTALFVDAAGNGMAGRIVAAQAPEWIDIALTGMVKNGTTDTESDMALAVAGGRETYRLTQQGEQTLMEVHIYPDNEYMAFLIPRWEKALEIIRQLSETV
ncbi:MAG: SRPBCC domain-containing protein [Chitinophagia bacterium]|nr:SRPBCC domain-containing protein [Chitinophagia bacterium]